MTCTGSMNPIAFSTSCNIRALSPADRAEAFCSVSNVLVQRPPEIYEWMDSLSLQVAPEPYVVVEKALSWKLPRFFKDVAVKVADSVCYS